MFCNIRDEGLQVSATMKMRSEWDLVTELLLVNSSMKFRDPYSNPSAHEAVHVLLLCTEIKIPRQEALVF